MLIAMIDKMFNKGNLIMKHTLIIMIIFAFSVSCLFSQTEETITLDTETGKLEGTVLLPKTVDEKLPVVLIIPGSGPTDRNGNNAAMTNNSLKLLAEGLAEKGIASLRYDKRGVGGSSTAAISEDKLRFENYIDDAGRWLEALQQNERFGNITVIGHSQGSLIGMIITTRLGANKFISIAGSGETINETIIEQLKAQPEFVSSAAFKILDSLEKGNTVNNVPDFLNSLFRPSIQPYMISWMKYDPQHEVSKIEVPVLIIQGTTDIQVSKKNAEILKEANLKAELIFIEGMNHIFKESEMDREQNLLTYNNPDLPLKEGLIDYLAEFIKR